MSLFGCGCRPGCTVKAFLVSALIGIVAAFLQITGTITVTTAFLWVALGIAVVYLGVVLVSSALADLATRWRITKATSTLIGESAF